MAAITDYASLKTALQQYSHRDDNTLSPVYDIFDGNVTAKINQRLRCRQMEQLTTITSDTGHFTLPADFLELRSVYNGVDEIPACLSPNQFNSSNTPGVTEFSYYIYSAIVTTSFTAGESQDLEIIYYAKLDPLSTTNTNGVLTTYPMLYLAGHMAEYCTFSEDDMEYRQYWLNMFESQISTINNESTNAKYSGAPLSVRVF